MSNNTNPKANNGGPKFNLNWFYALIIVILGILYLTNQDGGIKKSITYTEFQNYVEKDTSTRLSPTTTTRSTYTSNPNMHPKC